MQLKELADATGVSVASIKFYRRRGLLPAGEPVRPTRHEYGTAHLERLALITVLREVADASIHDIGVLTAMLDDPARPLVEALDVAQSISRGLPAAVHASRIPADEDPLVRDLLSVLGWPDLPSGPRHELDRLIRSMRAADLPVGPGLLLRYGRLMSELAAGDIAEMWEGSDAAVNPEVEPGNGSEPSRDVVVMRAVVGMVSYEKLAQVLRALGHVAHSVGAAGRGRGAGTPC